jgi:hypothetical protein
MRGTEQDIPNPVCYLSDSDIVRAPELQHPVQGSGEFGPCLAALRQVLERAKPARREKFGISHLTRLSRCAGDSSSHDSPRSAASWQVIILPALARLENSIRNASGTAVSRAAPVLGSSSVAKPASRSPAAPGRTRQPRK